MKSSKAVVAERQKQIVRLLQKENMDVNRLASICGVTTATIRRDLTFLEKQGILKRHFGGATYVLPPESDVSYDTPKGNPTPVRLAIARRAAEMISDSDLVYLNSSSTALYIIDYLKDIHCSIVTNNGRALYAEHSDTVDLFLTGGEVYGNKQSLIGYIAMNALRSSVATKCFMGTSGISAAGGVTSSVLQECSVNQEMVSRCDGPVIVVADGSKIGVRQKFFSYEASKVTHLITDRSADPRELDALRALGIEVILVDPE